MKRKIRNGSKGKSDNTEDSWTSVKHDNKFSSLRTHNSYGTPKAKFFLNFHFFRFKFKVFFKN